MNSTRGVPIPSRRCVSRASSGAVRWRGSHLAWRRDPSTSPGPRRSRAGPEAPGETFPRRENGEQEDDQAAMEDDQTREEDPVGDDREAFKREQELQPA